MKKLIGLFLICLSTLTSHAALSWHWAYLPSDITASNQIAASMNQAVATFNTYSDYNYNIPVAYNPGVPTAQASYHGWVEFGGQRNYRVAIHEMCHWLGTGSQGAWNNFRQGNTWIGTYANSAAQAYDGPGAGVGADTQHYWPYGWNFDSEAVYPERLVGFVGGFLRDMGIEDDKTIGFAPGTYRLRNRVSTKLLDNLGSPTDGAQVKQWGDSSSPNQQWVLSLVPGTTYFTLRSVATGKYLDSLGNTTDGAAVGQAAENFNASQQWQVVKTDSGYYKIINVANGKALDTGGQMTDGTGMQNWFSNASWNQQWKFVHTALATIPPGLISQYRPVSASSSLGGHLPVNGNDGNIPFVRWTANGGAFPQWWRVDLGSMHTITNLTTYWYPGFSFQYRIEVSSNDVNYTVAVDATGNTVVGTTTDNFSASARYVRITTTGINPGGWASFYECQVFGTPQIPAAPTGLAATPVSSSQINLSWTDAGGVSGYNVKRATTSGGPYNTIATNVKGVTYSDSGLSSSTTYYYVVSAVNSAGESSNSAQASATTSAPSVPPAPTGLSAIPGDNQVGLNWNAASEATSYNVKRATVNGGPYGTIGSPTATSYNDATAVNGTTYYYVVSAVNISGESANSSQVSATPNDLLAHLKFDETSGTTAADLSGNGNNATLQSGAAWAAGKINNAVSLNGTSTSFVTLPAGVVSTLNDFSIATWVYVNASGTWARLFDFGTGTGNYMFLSPASGGNSVRYAITTGSGEQQINSAGVLSPGAWHHVAVTLSGTTGTLYIDGVSAGFNSGMTLKPSSLGGTTQNYIGKSQWPDPYLNGLVDDFRIYRRALSGSEIATLFSAGGNPPATPTGLSATPGDNQVGLTWNASSGATSYNVKRATTSGGPYSTIASPGVTGYTDTTAVNGTTYYYVVSAVNASGESANSSEASATPAPPIPPVPTGLAATPGDNQVGLNWNASSGAGSYNVKRGTVSGGPYNTIGSLATTSYTDTTAVNGTTYYYVVSAVNTSGESGNSSQVSATPVTSLPSPWVTADIGAVGATGSASYSGGTFTVTGSGADIWGTADEFRYVRQTSSGNCEMRARVATIQNTDPSAKSGVMIRESTAAGARYAAVFVTPGNGVTFQRRTSTGGSTVSTTVTGVTAPRYVRIQRASSNSFRAYYSSNGSTWTQIGSNQTISMASSATMGLAVTSHLDGALFTSTLDSVTATP